MKSPILDGILWTAIRSMMLDVDSTDQSIDDIRRVAGHLTLPERSHTAHDIRRNIEWNKDYTGCAKTAPKWEELAIWLASGESPKHKEPLPRTRISSRWFRLIKYSLTYIHNRHSYAVGYADDIAMFYPMMSEQQRSWLDGWCKRCVCAHHDEPVRKLAAFSGLSNRYLVSAKATAAQVRKWVNDNNVAYLGGEYRDIEVTDIECFLFEGKYIPTDTYVKRPATVGGVIEEFITDIKQIEKQC